MRVGSSGWPLEARRKAWARERAARRVGSRIRPCARWSGSAVVSQPVGGDGVEGRDVRREGVEVHAGGGGRSSGVRRVHGRGWEGMAR